MTMLLSALAAVAAFCIWLTVRIVNRRERWAKRTAVGLAIAMAYPLGVGPACWIEARIRRDRSKAMFVSAVYRPILNSLVPTADTPLKFAIYRYVQFGLPRWGIELRLDDHVWFPPLPR